jgi:hypothetical protein
MINKVESLAIEVFRKEIYSLGDRYKSSPGSLGSAIAYFPMDTMAQFTFQMSGLEVLACAR